MPAPKRARKAPGATKAAAPEAQVKKTAKRAQKPKEVAKAVTPEAPPQERRLIVVDALSGESIGPYRGLDLSTSPIHHYSHSFVKSIASCTAKAYFKKQHVECGKIFALERGSCVHTLLEAFAKEGKDPIAGLPDQWRHYITDNLEKMSVEDRDKAAKGYEDTKLMLVEFVQENKFFSGRVEAKDVELEFNLEIPLQYGDKKFTRLFNGKIDLILWSKDRTKYRVIDYKTVQTAPGKDELALDTQFALYQYAATTLFGIPPSAMDFYMLKGIHMCSDRFSSQKHPRDPLKRVPGCEIAYALKVPLKTDEEIKGLFNAYYAPQVIKYEAGIIGKDGRGDIRNQCARCEYRPHCDTVTSFPTPVIL